MNEKVEQELEKFIEIYNRSTLEKHEMLTILAVLFFNAIEVNFPEYTIEQRHLLIKDAFEFYIKNEEESSM